MSVNPLRNKPQEPVNLNSSNLEKTQKRILESKPLVEKDRLTVFEKKTEILSVAPETAPQLIAPKANPLSFSEFLSIIGDSLLKYKQQLTLGQNAVNLSNMQNSQAAVDQAQALNTLISERSAALSKVEDSTNDAMTDLTNLSTKISDQVQKQQGAIDTLNSGNAAEQKAFQNLVTAYNTYISQLKSIGVVDQGDGTFLVPDDKIKEYNTYTEQYQKSVADFNTYWNGRKSELEAFNNSTNTYNTNALDNNQALQDFSDTYDIQDLPDQPSSNQATIPTIPVLTAPSTLKSGPAVITIYPLPSDITKIATSGPTSVSSLPSYTAPDIGAISEEAFSGLYTEYVSYYDECINVSLTTFTSTQKMNSNSGSMDPLMNDKPLLETLLKNFFKGKNRENSFNIDPQVASKQELMTRSFINKSTQKVLGNEILKAEIKASLENLTENEIDNLTMNLQALSLTLLQDKGLNALYPAFSLLANHLSLLPKNHPAFGAVFALSLMNRIQEGASLGINQKAVQAFVKNHLLLQNLKPEAVKNIGDALNTSLLLVGLKLIEKNLGLPGLTAQVILQSDSSTASAVTAALKEKQNDLKTEEKEFTNYFSSKNYPPQEAQFLAKVGSNLIDLDLSPNAASISDKTVDFPFLKESLAAAILSVKPALSYEKSLEKAETTFEETLKETLEENLNGSIAYFKENLTTHLCQMGLSKDEASTIASQVVIVPQKISLETASPLPITHLKETIKTRISELMPSAIATVLYTEIEKTLFSTISQEIVHEEESPSVPRLSSTIEILKTRFDSLKEKKESSFADKQADAFKETIKTAQDCATFFLQQMNPAYLFVFSVCSGIIYPSSKQDKPLII